MHPKVVRTAKPRVTELPERVAQFDKPLRRTRLLEGIARGEQALQKGHTLPHAQAITRMAQWLD